MGALEEKTSDFPPNQRVYWERFFLGLLASETIFRRTFWSLESLEYCTSTGIGIEYEMLFMRYFDILNPQNHVTVGVRNLAPVVRVGHLSHTRIAFLEVGSVFISGHFWCLFRGLWLGIFIRKMVQQQRAMKI